MKAPGVVFRQPVNEPMYTGLKAIDAMTPIGRGQRELIIGDRQIGKTAIGIDAIIRQKETGREVHLRRHRPEEIHRRPGGGKSRRSTTPWITPCVVAACASDPAHPPVHRRLCRLQPWANTSGTRARHALIIYDDLSKQAVAYRQISLLLRRPPGTRGLSRRHLLQPLPPAGAGLPGQQ